MGTATRPQDLGHNGNSFGAGDGGSSSAGRTDARRARRAGNNAEGLANFLGWFSIGLGVAQLASPRGMSRLVGGRGEGDSDALMRGLGVREIASGVGILSKQRPAEWVWARVAGDAMDLALLGRNLKPDNPRRGRAVASAAAVLGVAALDYYVAQQLSREGGAQAGKGIHVQKSITVNLPPEQVYAFWHNFENLPRFMQHLESVQTTGDRRSHWKAKAPAGTTVEWDAEITEDRPNELIAWRSVGEADVENQGVVRFTRAAGGRGTEVHVELRYDPPAGKLGALVAKLFGEEPNGQVAGDLRRFKQVLETGEVVHSDASLHRGPHPAQPPKERQAPRQDNEPALIADRSADAAAKTSSNLDRSSTTARGGHGEART